MAISGCWQFAGMFLDAAGRCGTPVYERVPRLRAGFVRTMQRFFLTVSFVLAANASLAAPPPVNPADAVAFMNELWTRAVEVLNQKADPAERRARFAQIFHQDFDGPGIARFVVGRYWRTASPEEQQEFIRVFEDYVVFVYTARLGDFGGDRFKVRGSRSDGDGVIVSTAIFRSDNPSPINVDWRLVTDKGAYKISDIIVEGISLGVTQRSEFASVVQRNGGQLRNLIALMQAKTADGAH